MNSAGLTPAGVTLCTVSDQDGGGMSPINTGAQGAPCPDGGTVASPDNPAWYEINANSSQGANMVATNACSFAPRPANSCYTLTDRGTFDYLASKNSPSAGTTGIPALRSSRVTTARRPRVARTPSSTTSTPTSSTRPSPVRP